MGSCYCSCHLGLFNSSWGRFNLIQATKQEEVWACILIILIRGRKTLHFVLQIVEQWGKYQETKKNLLCFAQNHVIYQIPQSILKKKIIHVKVIDFFKKCLFWRFWGSSFCNYLIVFEWKYKFKHVFFFQNHVIYKIPQSILKEKYSCGSNLF